MSSASVLPEPIAEGHGGGQGSATFRGEGPSTTRERGSTGLASSLTGPQGTPVVGFAGWSGSGKTTLIEAVVRVLSEQGWSLAVVKHAHHLMDIDQPGKDSWRHRKAGARQMLVASPTRWALIHELRAAEAEPGLEELLHVLAPCDLVLVEGFKRAPIPKIEVWRGDAFGPPLWPTDPWVRAVATMPEFYDTVTGKTRLPLLDPQAVAAHVLVLAGLRSLASESMPVDMAMKQ